MPSIRPDPIRVRTVTKTGTQEITRESEARARAESWIESATSAVHTLMFADGTYTVWTYSRGSEGAWVRKASLAGDARGAQ